MHIIKKVFLSAAPVGLIAACAYAEEYQVSPNTQEKLSEREREPFLFVFKKEKLRALCAAEWRCSAFLSASVVSFGTLPYCHSPQIADDGIDRIYSLR